MHILVAGSWSTGSTALFNLTRLLCEADGPTWACYDDEYWQAAVDCKHSVVKTHKFQDHWVDWADDATPGLLGWVDGRMRKHYNPRKLIFVADRDEGEVIKSMERFRDSGGKTLRADPSKALRGFRHAGWYLEHSILKVDYKYFRERRTQKHLVLANKIREILRFNISDADLRKVVLEFEKIRPPDEGYDAKTLLHFNHIADVPLAGTEKKQEE